MPDDKNSREKQARDAERRQQAREIATALSRGEEVEPPVPATELAAFEAGLDALSFPATGAEVVAAVGDREIDAVDGPYTVEELVPDTEAETFDSPAAVRAQVQQPRVAAAMTRVIEACTTLRNADFGWTRRKAYETTFQELAAINPVDEDPGIEAIADWILERIREKQSLPSSRAVRREAAKYCRANGYQVRNDEWLGI